MTPQEDMLSTLNHAIPILIPILVPTTTPTPPAPHCSSSATSSSSIHLPTPQPRRRPIHAATSAHRPASRSAQKDSPQSTARVLAPSHLRLGHRRLQPPPPPARRSNSRKHLRIARQSSAQQRPVATSVPSPEGTVNNSSKQTCLPLTSSSPSSALHPSIDPPLAPPAPMKLW